MIWLFLLLYLLNFHNTDSYTLQDLQIMVKLTRNRVIDHISVYVAEPGDISYILSTRCNPYQPITNFENNIIGLVKGAPLKVIIHGFQSSPAEIWVKNITEAFHKNKKNINILMVDWSKIAHRPISQYNKVVGHMFSLASILTKNIMQLRRDLQISFNEIHLLGHSLGAHLAGIIGWQLQKHFGEELGRITGLDPALPLFVKASAMYKLDISDAFFVDVIHTDCGKFGIAERSGSVDFYPQGGISPQPACEVNKTEPIRIYREKSQCDVIEISNQEQQIDILSILVRNFHDTYLIFVLP